MAVLIPLNSGNTAKLILIQVAHMFSKYSRIRHSIKKLLLLMFLSGIAFGAHKPPRSRAVRSQTGTAVYYSDKMDGRTVSLKGEKYDKNGLTAATHNNFPLGSRIKVTNLRNRKSVELRVTDRMNPRSKAIIDVSHKAADQLGMIHSGHAQVRIELISRS